jgi:hypothetical protein
MKEEPPWMNQIYLKLSDLGDLRLIGMERFFKLIRRAALDSRK